MSINDGITMEDEVMLRALEIARAAGRAKPNEDDYAQAKHERDYGTDQ